MTFLREGALCSLLAAYRTSEQTRPFSWCKTSVNYDWESPAYLFCHWEDDWMVRTFPFGSYLMGRGCGPVRMVLGEERKGGLRVPRYLKRKHLQPRSGNDTYYNQVFLGERKGIVKIILWFLNDYWNFETFIFAFDTIQVSPMWEGLDNAPLSSLKED